MGVGKAPVCISGLSVSRLREVNDTGSQEENPKLPAMTATLSLGLQGVSERQAAQGLAVPRSTLQA
jgi:hypothetical protein